MAEDNKSVSEYSQANPFQGEFIEFKDENDKVIGFQLVDDVEDVVYIFDKHEGWYDLDGTYYNKDAEKVFPPPSDSERKLPIDSKFFITKEQLLKNIESYTHNEPEIVVEFDGFHPNSNEEMILQFIGKTEKYFSDIVIDNEEENNDDLVAGEFVVIGIQKAKNLAKYHLDNQQDANGGLYQIRFYVQNFNEETDRQVYEMQNKFNDCYKDSLINLEFDGFPKNTTSKDIINFFIQNSPKVIELLSNNKEENQKKVDYLKEQQEKYFTKIDVITTSNGEVEKEYNYETGKWEIRDVQEEDKSQQIVYGDIQVDGLDKALFLLNFHRLQYNSELIYVSNPRFYIDIHGVNQNDINEEELLNFFSKNQEEKSETQKPHTFQTISSNMIDTFNYIDIDHLELSTYDLSVTNQIFRFNKKTFKTSNDKSFVLDIKIYRENVEIEEYNDEDEDQDNNNNEEGYIQPHTDGQFEEFIPQLTQHKLDEEQQKNLLSIFFEEDEKIKSQKVSFKVNFPVEENFDQEALKKDLLSLNCCYLYREINSTDNNYFGVFNTRSNERFYEIVKTAQKHGCQVYIENIIPMQTEKPKDYPNKYIII